MELVRLGRSELMVSPIAFGTWQLGGDWGHTDEERAVAAIRRAADSGINFFDTAQAYGFGASERLLSRALTGRRREDLVIATKGGLRPTAGGGVQRDASPEWVRQGVEESLTALRTDHIDLYQVHWPDPAVPFEATAEALAELVRSGKIRHVGVSNFDAGQMEEFSRTLQVETLQPPYHLFKRDIEKSVLPYTRANDIGVLVYGPLAHGLLGGRLSGSTRFPEGDWRSTAPEFTGDTFRANLGVTAQLGEVAADLGIPLSRLAVAWTLTHPAVQVAIVGTRDPRHVDDAVRAAEVELDQEVLDRIDKIMAGAVPVAGPSPEGMPEA